MAKFTVSLKICSISGKSPPGRASWGWLVGGAVPGESPKIPDTDLIHRPPIAAAAPDLGVSWQWLRLGAGWCLAAAARGALLAGLTKGQETAWESPCPARVSSFSTALVSSFSCVFPTDPGKPVVHHRLLVAAVKACEGGS